MTLPDRPLAIIRWEIGLAPAVLQGIGKLAVVSAKIEQLLHLSSARRSVRRACSTNRALYRANS